jgi:hypothetical protein
MIRVNEARHTYLFPPRLRHVGWYRFSGVGVELGPVTLDETITSIRRHRIIKNHRRT